MAINRWLTGPLLAATVVAGQAEACPSFEEAVERAGHQYVALTQSRGVAIDDGPDFAGTDGALDAYIAVPSSPHETRARGLVFYLRDGDDVCGYFRSTQQWRLLEFRVEAEAEELSALIDRTVAAIAESAAPLERRAIRRSDAAEEQPLSRSARPLSRARGVDADPLLATLAGRLFPPVIAGEVSELSSLSIVPAVNIGMVPFAALDPDGDGVPLVETTAVNVEASLGDVLAGRLFALAGSVDPQAIAGDPDASRDPEWLFPRLPGAAREARAVAERFGTVAVIGPEATVAEVVPRMQAAQYVHIAAHGFSSVDDPVDGSFLALTGGRLTARTIQSLRLDHPALVTLSACQTGLGGRLDAGIVGLARGFILAGASAVLASLWNVDDDATAQIMLRYVENLATHPPAEALRRAQSEARARWNDPAKWAAFLMFGSRIVSLPEAAAAEGEPIGVAFSLTRAGQPLDFDPRAATRVLAEDQLAGRFSNTTAKPLDLRLLYMDATGASIEVLSERLKPGEIFDKPIVMFNDSTVGREYLFVEFATASPGSPLRLPGSLRPDFIPALPELAGVPPSGPLPRMLSLGGLEALAGSVGRQGISSIFDLAVADSKESETLRLVPVSGGGQRAVRVLQFEVAVRELE